LHFHIIIDHPWQESFTHCVLKAFISGLNPRHSVDCLDLNQEHFNPVMTADELALYTKGKYLDPKVGEYQARLRRADYLVLLFPIWWTVMPAALKGWLDKVLLPGFAFTLDQAPQPLLTSIKGASVLTTTAVSDEHHRSEYNNAIDWVLSKGTLNFCGIKPVTWLNFGEAGVADREQHDNWLKKVKQYAANL